jgi:uncharacterized protein YegL
MAGQPLLAVQEGVAKTLASLRKDPYALDTVYVSVIAFAAKAVVLTPLKELVAVSPPTLSLRPLDFFRGGLGFIAGVHPKRGEKKL